MPFQLIYQQHYNLSVNYNTITIVNLKISLCFQYFLTLLNQLKTDYFRAEKQFDCFIQMKNCVV